MRYYWYYIIYIYIYCILSYHYSSNTRLRRRRSPKLQTVPTYTLSQLTPHVQWLHLLKIFKGFNNLPHREKNHIGWRYSIIVIEYPTLFNNYIPYIFNWSGILLCGGPRDFRLPRRDGIARSQGSLEDGSVRVNSAYLLLFVVVINGYQWLSMVISNYQWLSTVINAN